MTLTMKAAAMLSVMMVLVTGDDHRTHLGRLPFRTGNKLTQSGRLKVRPAGLQQRLLELTPAGQKAHHHVPSSCTCPWFSARLVNRSS